MTLPTQSAPNADATPQISSGHNSGSTQSSHASPSSQAAEEGMDSHDVDAPYITPMGTQNSTSSPSRYCSVKGCKAMIPGDYFFKMCEPCRDRYRAYGITKRAKWRAERVAANTELEALRIEEDKRRADEGLPVRISNLITSPCSSNCPLHTSPWLKARKTGSPGKMTSSKDRSSPKLKINMDRFLRVCVPSPIVTLFYPDSTNTVAASSTGFRIDTIASSNASGRRRSRLRRQH